MNVVNQIIPESMVYDIVDFLVKYIMILYPLAFIFMKWRRIQSEKAKLQLKRYTMEYCINDKSNYEQILSNSNESLNKLNNNNDFENVIPILLNFEKISIGLNNGLFDEEIIKSYYGKYFITVHSKYKYFILKRRDLNQAPYMFIEFERLINRWSNYGESKGKVNI